MKFSRVISQCERASKVCMTCEKEGGSAGNAPTGSFLVSSLYAKEIYVVTL